MAHVRRVAPIGPAGVTDRVANARSDGAGMTSKNYWHAATVLLIPCVH